MAFLVEASSTVYSSDDLHFFIIPKDGSLQVV